MILLLFPILLMFKIINGIIDTRDSHCSMEQKIQASGGTVASVGEKQWSKFQIKNLASGVDQKR